MKATRWLTLLAAATVASVSLAADSVPPRADAGATSSTATPPPSRLDLNLFTPALSSSHLGLRPPSERARAGIGLPFGLNYNEETKLLSMPIDQKNEWGVGLNLDLYPSRPIELAPPSSPLGLQPKRAPGVMLQKRF